MSNVIPELDRWLHLARLLGDWPAVGVGIGAATNTLIGNSIGEKKEREASLYIAQSLIFSCVISVFVTLFGLNASNFLLKVMGSNFEGIVLTRKYLDIIFYGTFIVLIQISLNGTLNAQGTASAPIIFTSVVDEVQPGGNVSPNLEPDVSGLWGGIIVLGNAPSSLGDDAAETNIEGILLKKYFLTFAIFTCSI